MSAADIPAPTERLVAAQKVVRARWLKSRYLLSGPALVIISIFGVLPLTIMVIYSFLKAGDYGGVQWIPSVEAYISFLFQRDIFDGTLTFSNAYLLIYLRSILFAATTTVICLVLGFPTAYFMATRPAHQRQIWVFLVTIPFWSNLLVRTLAIMLIIRDEGLINDTLIWLGLIDKPIVILYTNFAVMLGLLYSFLPFMVLPIYSTLERIDFRLIEAAYDLYADRIAVFKRVVWPLAKPGALAGVGLVFAPALGSFLAPDLLGGGKKLLIGSLIQMQFSSSRNWPFGAALSTVIAIAVLLVFALRARRAPPQGSHA